MLSHLAGLVLALTISNASPVDAGFHPNTPMPDRPGCHHTSCEDVWNGERRVRRCHWRCPSQRHASPPRQLSPRDDARHSRSLPSVWIDTSADAVDPKLLLLGAAAVFIVLLVVAASLKSSADADTESTKALAKKLEDAARAADAHIRAFLASERKRGGDHG